MYHNPNPNPNVSQMRVNCARSHNNEMIHVETARDGSQLLVITLLVVREQG